MYHQCIKKQSHISGWLTLKEAHLLCKRQQPTKIIKLYQALCYYINVDALYPPLILLQQTFNSNSIKAKNLNRSKNKLMHKNDKLLAVEFKLILV